MSEFRYGDVHLLLVKTNTYKVEAEHDPSGVDHLWTKYELDVTGVLSPSAGTLPTNSPQTLAEVQHELSLPRRDLLYKIGTQTILDVKGPDAKYGPKPKPCSFEEVAEGVFFVRWGCVAWKAGCDDAAGGSQVVSNRWTTTDDRDVVSGCSTIRTRGRLVTRSDLRGLPADAFRSVTVPELGADTVREHCVFTLNPSGTELEYEFTDVEKYLLPPYPATWADMDFYVRTNMPGALRMAQVDVKLKGPKGVNRRLLLARAVQVAYAKLLAAGPQMEGGVIPMGFTLGERGFENGVHVAIQAMLKDTKTPAVALANKSMFGDTPYCPPNQPGIQPDIRGQLGVLFPAAFRDPCGTESQLVSGDATAPKEDHSGRRRPVITTAQLSPDLESPAFDPSRDPGGYDFFACDVRFIWKSGTIPMPATGVGKDGHKAAAVQFGGGMLRMVCDWTAKRQGAPPVLPSYFPPEQQAGPDQPRPGGGGQLVNVQSRSNFVPIGEADIKVQSLERSGDPRFPIHCVSGTYEYLVLDPRLVNITAPIPPFFSDEAAQAAEKSVAFQDERILWKFQKAAGVGGNPFDATRLFLTVPQASLLNAANGAVGQGPQLGGNPQQGGQQQGFQGGGGNSGQQNSGVNP